VSSPGPSDHLEQARANRSHAEWLISTSPNDPTALQWAVTASFYSALHALTATLIIQGVSVWSHTMRNQALGSVRKRYPGSQRIVMTITQAVR
jgi:hypothetical protein